MSVKVEPVRAIFVTAERLDVVDVLGKVTLVVAELQINIKVCKF
jgi:hypothetical protein